MTNGEGPLGTVNLAATTLYVTDLDSAVRWYRDKFELEPMAVGTDPDHYASYLVGGTIVVLEPRSAALEGSPPGAESTTVNLVVDRDPREVRPDLIGRGVQCGELVESFAFRSFLMRDLDGNRFYVTRPVSGGAEADVEKATAITG